MIGQEGVDYSATLDDDWGELAAAIVARCGKGAPVGRYAVSDKSPAGRGIAKPEYEALVKAGLKPFFFWEGSASWMLGGYGAGVQAAQSATLNAVAAGAPPDSVVYFAHDIEPERVHLPQIDACLNGVASIFGWDRIGVYGGWALIDYLAGGGNVKYLCQTSAWEWDFGDYPNYRGVHPAACLYQHAYNQWIGSTNCDLVRVLKEDFGAAIHEEIPSKPKPPKYARPELPAWWATALKQRHPSDALVDGNRWHVVRRNVEAIGKTYRYSRPDIKSPKAGPPIAVREKVAIERTFVDADKKQWFVCGDGCYVYAGKFTPRVRIDPR